MYIVNYREEEWHIKWSINSYIKLQIREVINWMIRYLSLSRCITSTIAEREAINQIVLLYKIPAVIYHAYTWHSTTKWSSYITLLSSRNSGPNSTYIDWGAVFHLCWNSYCFPGIPATILLQWRGGGSIVQSVLVTQLTVLIRRDVSNNARHVAFVHVLVIFYVCVGRLLATLHQ